MVAAVSALGVCSCTRSRQTLAFCDSRRAAPIAQRSSRLLEGLNLTDAQRQQLHQTLQSDHSANKGLMLNLLNAEKALHDAIVKNPNDEATIRSLSVTEVTPKPS